MKRDTNHGDETMETETKIDRELRAKSIASAINATSDLTAKVWWSHGITEMVDGHKLYRHCRVYVSDYSHEMGYISLSFPTGKKINLDNLNHRAPHARLAEIVAAL
jgi:hypothetical protein